MEQVRCNKSETTEYSSWESMKQRCFNSKNKHFKNYGGRGITICEKWLTFDGFFEDMGLKLGIEFSLDRIDTNGNYCKENCQWSNRYIQDRNKRNNIYIDYNGEVTILCDLAKKVGMHQQTLKARLLRGLPVEEAVIKSFKYVKSNKYKKKNVILL